MPSSTLPQWGRVLIAGGTDWPNLGRKPTGPKVVNEAAPDLHSPHILRALSNIRITRVFTSHSSSHSVFLAVDGRAWVLGRNERGQCGVDAAARPALHVPHMLAPSDFEPPLPDGNDGHIVYAATGRTHTLLVTGAGAVYSAGDNKLGQCGQDKLGDITRFKRIDGAAYTKEKDAAIAVSCGLGFSLILTRSGKVYAMGSSEKGQLGNGKTGEHFVSANKLAFATYSEPTLVRALADKKIVQIACGQQHSIALEDNGYVYVWGFGGYGRLGTGTQHDVLVPQLVTQFARDNQMTRATAVFAGPTCSAVIDGQAMYYVAGKWKTSGDGGAGQGYMTFKYLQELMGVHCLNAALGGVTLLVTARELESANTGPQEATMNVCWGQGANNGELGVGVGKPKSATKPQRCETLDRIAVLDVGAAQNTTFYVVRNMGDAYSDLPRFPELVDSSDLCKRCGREESARGPDDALLECEKCENPRHLACLEPPLSEVPEGEWHCPDCIADAGAAGYLEPGGKLPDGGGKRKVEDDEDDESSSKRAKGRTPAKKRK